MRQLLTSKGAGESNAVHTTGQADSSPPPSSEVVETSPTTVPVTAHTEAVELASPSVAGNSCATTLCRAEEFSPSPASSTERLPCSRCAEPMLQ